MAMRMRGASGTGAGTKEAFSAQVALGGKSCNGTGRRWPRAAACALLAALFIGGEVSVAVAVPSAAPAASPTTAKKSDVATRPADLANRHRVEAVHPDLALAAGVAVDDTGHAYVTYFMGLARVNVADGKMERVASDLESPDKVALDGEGNAYVTENLADSDRLSRVNLSTGKKEVIIPRLERVKSIAVSKGDLYLVALREDGKGELRKLNPRNGNSEGLLHDIEAPGGVAVDENHVYVTSGSDGGELRRMSRSGGGLERVATGLGEGITDMDVLRGKAYVLVDDYTGIWAKSRLLRVDLGSGQWKQIETVGDFSRSTSVAVSEKDDHAYVTDYAHGSLLRVRDARIS